MAGQVRELTGVCTVKVPSPGLIRIRALRDLFPCEGFDVEHVDVCDHSPFCDEAPSLEKAKRVRIGLPQRLRHTYR